jgi:hypothetical protein
MNIDKIEIVTEFKHLQVRFTAPLFDGAGNQVSSQTHRDVVTCGDFEKANAIGGEVAQLAQMYWTPERVAAYQATLPQPIAEDGEVQE